MQDDRRALHANLAPTCHESWHRQADEVGVSLTGLMEAIADDWDQYPPDDGGHPRWESIKARARKVDANRRRRSTREKPRDASALDDLEPVPMEFLHFDR